MFVLGEGHSLSPQDVFTASGDTELGMQWMQKFPSYTKENLRRHNVMRLNNAEYYFVHESHPVVFLLYNNQEQLGTKIDENDRVHGEWYRVGLQVFDDSCQTLDVEIFNKTPQVYDLSKLRLRLRRPDNKPWLDPPLMHPSMLCPTTDMEEKKRLYQQYCNTIIFLTCRLQVEYCVPSAVEETGPTTMPKGE